MFSGKQKVIGYILFLLVFFLLVPHVQNVLAVAFGGDCSIYPCDADLTCSSNVCIDATTASCVMSGPTAVCRGSSVSYSTNGSDANINGGGVYWNTTSLPQVWDPPICVAGATGDCTGSITFSSTGTYYVVCNVYDSAGNKCSGNPFVPFPPGWYDCGDPATLTVTVTDPPAEITCASLACHTNTQYPPNGTCGGTNTCTSNAPAAVSCSPTYSYCGYPGGDVVPDGDCTTTTCPAVPDNSPPAVPAPAITATVCSGSVSVTWPGVSDVGCYGGVNYQLQVKDNVAWILNDGWGDISPYTIASPVVGRTYYAQIQSRDAGNNQSTWSAGALWTTGVPYCCPTTPTLISPIGSTCNGPTFPPTYSWNAVTGASGYNLTISKGGIACFSGAVGNVTTASPDVSGCTTTGTYTWTVQATYDGGCAPSGLSAAGSFDYDKTAPPVPVPTIQLSPDATCLGKYKVVHSWNAVTNTPAATYGCAALDPNPYWSQASLNIGFPTNVFPINTWGTYTSQTTSSSYAPGTTVYTHVASRDALGNPSPIVWSGPETIIIPTPSPYPTIHVSGPLSEDINGTCNPMTLVSSFTLAPVIAPVAGITPAVTPICPTLAPGATTYSCDFIIDNQKGDCVSPDITVTMGGTYSGYGTIGWRTGSGGGQCNGSPTSNSYTAGGPTPAAAPIYFSYIAILPTPLPTVTPGGPTVTPSPTSPPVAGWFKLKDSSFNSRLSGRTNYIPSNIQSYGDGDTVSFHDMLIGSAGVLLQDGRLEPGANALDANGNPIYSHSSDGNGWYTQGYTSTNDIDYLKYIDYLKGRRNITSISTPSEVTTGIYTITPSDDITLNSADFDNKKVVLVVEGDKNVIISSDFIPANGSVALLAKKIVIESSVTEVKAILIGQSITTGDSTSPLKIEGNIIDEEALTLGRARNDGSRPSLFVVSNVQMYLDLLPYLSTSTYDWKQIQ